MAGRGSLGRTARPIAGSSSLRGILATLEDPHLQGRQVEHLTAFHPASSLAAVDPRNGRWDAG